MALRRSCSTAAPACRRATSTRCAPLLAGVFSPILYQQRGLLPTTIDEPFTVETNVADAEAVIDAAAGGRAWIVGHSWGGHLALHLLVSCPERIAGAIIVDPLGAHLEVMEEFGKRLEAPLTDEERARFEEIEAGRRRARRPPRSRWRRCAWSGRPTLPIRRRLLRCRTSSSWCRRSRGRWRRSTRTRRRRRSSADCPRVPAEIPVLFVHGAASPMPVHASTESAKLIPHAEVEVIEGAGHFIWHERPDEVRDVVRAFVARSSS